jgi:hypothetical protein
VEPFTVVDEPGEPVAGQFRYGRNVGRPCHGANIVDPGLFATTPEPPELAAHRLRQARTGSLVRFFSRAF